MYFDDFETGYKFDIPDALIEKEAMLDFAKKYDNIPLHTDEEYAKKTSFGGLIAPGVMSFMTVWAKYLEIDLFGQELIAGMSTKIMWHKPVFAGDTLTSYGEVTGLTKRNHKNGIVELTLYIYNQDNVLVMTDITEAVVKCRQVN